MATKQPPTDEDARVALTLIIMHASGAMLDDDGSAVQAMASSLWPKTIHRDALAYGSGAIATIAAAFGLDAEQVASLAQHMFANT